jgi:hypothetical protein
VVEVPGLVETGESSRGQLDCPSPALGEAFLPSENDLPTHGVHPKLIARPETHGLHGGEW